MRYTTEDIKELALKKHKNKYNLELIKYKNSYNKIKIECNKHKTIIEVDAIEFIRENKNIDYCRDNCNISKKEIKQKTIDNAIDNTNKTELYILKLKDNKFKTNFSVISIEILEQKTQKALNTKFKNYDIEIIEKREDTYKNLILYREEIIKKNKSMRIHLPKEFGLDDYIYIEETTQLTASTVKIIRDGLLEHNNNICPVCNKEVKLPTLDHYHTRKHNGDGLIRGAICNNCNRMLGVIENKALMNAINFSDLPEYLISIAKYITKDGYPLLHPSEKPKSRKLKKTSYNKLKKVYDRKAKFPQYPRNGKLNKKLEKLFDIYNINIEYYAN